MIRMPKEGTDPTMERPSKAGKREAGDRLNQQYMDLKQEWDTIKQSTHKPRALLRSRSLTDSRTMVKALLDNSPRGLMCSLQQEGGWQATGKHYDPVVEEILRDRKAAIESRKLKGRRLFEGVEESVSENDHEMGNDGRREEITCSGLDGLVQESSEVRSVCSFDSDGEKENADPVQSKNKVSPSHDGYFFNSSCAGTCSSSSSTSSFVCNECMEREFPVKEEREKVVMVGSVDAGKRGAIAYGERWMSLVCLLAIGLLVGVISIIVSRRKFHGHGNGDEVFLVPT